MAASPQAQFPEMRVLSTVDLDGGLGARDGAERAAGALLAVPGRHGVVAPGVEFRRRDDQGFLAGRDAQEALLAAFPVDDDAAFRHSFLRRKG